MSLSNVTGLETMDDFTPRCPQCGTCYLPGVARCSCGWLLESVEPVAMGSHLHLAHGGDVRNEDVTPPGLPPLEPHGPPPPPPVVQLVLLVEGDEDVRFQGARTRRIPLGDRRLLIGRRDAVAGIYPDVDLQGLRDYGYTSRRHAEVFLEGEQVFLVDIPGLKTTALNDLGHVVPARRPVELRVGDRLIVGETVTFVVAKEEL